MKNLAIVILSLFATIANCQTIHWLIFVDTNDNHTGQGSINSRNILFHDFIDVVDTSLIEKNYKVEIHDVKGDSLSPNKCIEIISKLNCESNDVVFFYYIGHGYNTVANNSPFPLLTMGSSDIKGAIPLTWVQESIKKKNPRLSICIGMCGNVFYEKVSSELIMRLDSMANKYNTQNSAIEYEKEDNSIDSLFMKYKGDVIVTSASLGEASLGDNNGDIFTRAFVASLEEIQIDGHCDWFRLLKSTQQIVEDVTEGKQKPTWNIEYLYNKK